MIVAAMGHQALGLDKYGLVRDDVIACKVPTVVGGTTALGGNGFAGGGCHRTVGVQAFDGDVGICLGGDEAQDFQLDAVELGTLEALVAADAVVQGPIACVVDTEEGVPGLELVHGEVDLGDVQLDFRFQDLPGGVGDLTDVVPCRDEVGGGVR